KDPKDRYATPGELLEALKRIPAEASDSELELGSEHDTPLPALGAGLPTPPSPAFGEASALGRPGAPGPPSAAPTPWPKGSSQYDISQLASSSTPDVSMAAPAAEAVPAHLVTPEQFKAAMAFHERAVRALAEGGGEAYARELLANCLRLDPFTPAYRQTLRDL